LQSYFVDNQETNNFTTIDLPTSVVSFDESKLTEEQKQAYKSVKRLNFLGYRMKEGNEVEYKGKIASMGTLSNITERMKSEEALRNSEESYRELFDNATDATDIF